MINSTTLPTTTDRNNPVPLTIYAGVALLGLLPAGIVLGTTSFVFSAIAILHGILQLAALFTTLLFVGRLAASDKRSSTAASATILFTVLSITILGAVPITARDALIHHLAVPKWWLSHGSIHQINWHEWSYYPMLVDLGFTALLKHGMEWATPYYHATYLFLLAGLVAFFLDKAGRSSAEGIAGFCITLTIPIAFKLATIPVVDLGLALYTMVTLAALLLWVREGGSPRWVIYAGVALGLALGTKYNGILATAMILPMTIIFAVRSGLSTKRTLFGVLLLAVTAAIVFLPWAIKDFLWIGNPIYPLFNNLFPTHTTPSLIRGLSPLEQRTLLYHESLLQILLTPLRMLVFGADEDPRRFDGALTPILIFAVVPLFKSPRKPWIIFFAGISVLYFFLSELYAAPRVRYLAPLYGPLAVLTAAGVFEIAELLKPQRIRVLTGIFALQAAWFVLYLVGVEQRVMSFHFLASSQSKEDYLQQQLREYPMIQFINRETPKSALVHLLFTGNKFYLFDREVRSSGHYSGDELLGWLRANKTPGALLNSLHQQGVTHIAASIDLLRRGLESMTTEPELETWVTFQREGLTPIFELEGFVVWEVRG